MSEDYRPRRCLISDSAFLSMVLAASEVYKRETLGFLLGYHAGDIILVEYAIPLQMAERGYTWSKPPEHRLKRIEEISERFGLGLKLIGDFHSHAQLGQSRGEPEPSPIDVEYMNPDQLYLVIAVNAYRERVHKRWHRVGKKLKGCLGEYEFEIGAFYCTDLREYYEVEIRCPFAQAL